MYAKKACDLVKEFANSERGQLSAFNSNLFAQVIEECNFHFHQLQSLLSKTQELSAGQTTRNADHFGALIHHLSLVRNKRCVMAYVYNRAEVIRSLGWMIELPLPEEIQEKLSSSEKEYSKNHSATIKSYQSEVDLDLAVSMASLLPIEARMIFKSSQPPSFLIPKFSLFLHECELHTHGHQEVPIYVETLKDMVPPKDPYIKVRVLDDIGSVALSDQIANLACHAILFLRRTDAETYISQGLMEELTD